MLDAEVRERFKEFQEKTGKYKDLDIDEVRFEKKTINDIISKFIKGSTPKYSKEKTDFIVIKSGQARGNYNEFNFTKTAYLDTNKIKTIKKLDKGDILINTTGVGTAGRVTLFDLDENYVSDSHITTLRYDLNVYSKFYLLYFFVNFGFKRLESMAEGSGGQIELSMEMVKKIDIPIPKDLNKTYTSFKIQEAIVEFLEFWKDGYTDVVRERVSKKKLIYEAIKRIVVQNTFKYDKFLVEKFNDFVKDKGFDIKLENIIFEDKNITEFVNISRGKVISKKDLTVDGIYPVYSSQTKNDGLFGFANEYMHDGDAITWTTDGKHAGTTFLRSGKFNFTNVCGLMTIKESDKIDIRYLSYITRLIFPKHVDRTSQNSKLMTHHLDNIKVPIPNNNNLKSIDLQKLFLEFWKIIIEQIDNQLKTYQRMLELTDIIDRAFLYRTFSKIDWSKE